MSGGETLNEVRAFIGRFVVASEAVKDTLTLWVGYTYTWQSFPVAPYLAIVSPTKRCGKTRVLEVLECLVPNPWRAVAPTPAALFRTIEAEHPVLLLDELDTIFKGRTEAESYLQAVVNAGYRRGGFVPRCEKNGKEKMTVQKFEVFGPKVLAAIGHLPPTIQDRCITIHLERATVKLPRFILSRELEAAAPLRAALAEAFGGGVPDPWPTDIPSQLDDRAAEIWAPLLVIAEGAGGDWPNRAWRAAIQLSASRGEDETPAIEALAFVARLFKEHGADRLATTTIITEGQEAGVFDRDFTPRRLAKLLAPFGITPAKWKDTEGKTVRGYLREQVAAAAAVYTPQETATSATGVTTHDAANTYAVADGWRVALPSATNDDTPSQVADISATRHQSATTQVIDHKGTSSAGGGSGAFFSGTEAGSLPEKGGKHGTPSRKLI
ncbi:DUF3631 domain-containing protein [Thermoanaerobaculum aquaticum]|nr:DUF3631 domain-containing protein [Thermoanaerobaculum aquaticum]